LTEQGIPVLTAREIIKVLKKLGFKNTRKSRGSHFRYVHPDGRKTTVPVHKDD
jgi:predicted RNA binding protein YcfA (HicA-like mRNA interferase family)